MRAELIGNILVAKEGAKLIEERTGVTIKSDYNIYKGGGFPSGLLGKHDYVTSKDITMGLYGKSALGANGGFAPTITLKSDRLSDGTSIRFPLTETSVTADQRGVARSENTCRERMKYQVPCNSSIT